ncbi:hypothetical protein MMON44395_23755 [Mycolicibacterium monacense DSM 44395]|nr:hypothetical protein [Mycolicibacterium monacense DSM 44395]
MVISVIADPAAIEAAQKLIAAEDQHHAEPDPTPEPAGSEPVPCPQDSGVALLPGVKLLPIVALAEAIRGGAAIKPLWLPGPDPEPHYRPSATLAAFVRARDLFCRFPGCDVPAERCDIDHVIPWPYGPTHASNLVLVWGQLLGCDAAALSARITALLKGICDNDPRSVGERRSCAVGAIVQGHDHLPCRCGSPACAAAAPEKSNVVISVIADPAAVEAAQKLIAAEDQHHAEPDPTPEPAGSEPVPCPQDSGVALLPGVKLLPIVALAEAIRGGAAIKPLWLPGPDPEPHYRPSATLAAFVRARDLFCRFPGCDVPAERCDIDHVIPWPYGPTHASNLNCKCRTHHLGKTFWAGWHDEQSPDGTVTWTTPTGKRHTTVPGSRLFFPEWDTTTAELPPLEQPPPDPDRTAKMPKRRRTRAADNAARVKAERERAMADHAANADPPPPAPHPNYGDDPPPF